MSVTSSEPAPYAPAKAVLELIARFRNRGLPTPISLEVLGRAGITDSLIPRTFQALKVLDLIGEDGMPTPTFDGLRLAPEPDYKTRTAEWLNNAYADVLRFIDPANADETQIRDAFRNYKPVGQQDRMVTLFVGLYAAAGIGPEKAAKPRKATALKNSVVKSTNGNGGFPKTDVAGKGDKTDSMNSNNNHIPTPKHSPQTVYDVLLGVWKPGKMPKEVDDAVVTLMRWLKEQEHSASS